MVYELDFYGVCGESVELCSVILSVGFFFSCVLMVDIWEYFLELVIFEGCLFFWFKFLVFYLSRCVLYNFDFG